MKKILLTSVCVLAMAGAAFAQGTVNWQTMAPTAIGAQTNTALSPFFGGTGTGGTVGAAGGSAPLGTGFYYELLYTTYSGAQATIPSLSSLLSWSDAGLEATNASSAGRLVPIAGNAGATVPWNNGTTMSIVLVGWSANLGTSWSGVANLLATETAFAPGSYFGYSATGYINPLASGTSPGAALFGTTTTTQGLPINSPTTQLYALPVPEPATFAVAGLGGLALLAFRRRK